MNLKKLFLFTAAISMVPAMPTSASFNPTRWSRNTRISAGGLTTGIAFALLIVARPLLAYWSAHKGASNAKKCNLDQSIIDELEAEASKKWNRLVYRLQKAVIAGIISGIAAAAVLNWAIEKAIPNPETKPNPNPNPELEPEPKPVTPVVPVVPVTNPFTEQKPELEPELDKNIDFREAIALMNENKTKVTVGAFRHLALLAGCTSMSIYDTKYSFFKQFIPLLNQHKNIILPYLNSREGNDAFPLKLLIHCASNVDCNNKLNEELKDFNLRFKQDCDAGCLSRLRQTGRDEPYECSRENFLTAFSK